MKTHHLPTTENRVQQDERVTNFFESEDIECTIVAKTSIYLTIVQVLKFQDMLLVGCKSLPTATDQMLVTGTLLWAVGVQMHIIYCPKTISITNWNGENVTTSTNLSPQPGILYELNPC